MNKFVNLNKICDIYIGLLCFMYNLAKIRTFVSRQNDENTICYRHFAQNYTDCSL